MPSLDGSVGTNAQNKPHDVAVIQAALSAVKGPDRKPFWPGPIDGNYQRHRKTLDQAIGLFQQANRLRPSGKLNRLGSDVNRIENALPASHRRMVGVVGTAVVRRETSAAPARIEGAIRQTQAMPLPRAERKALAGLQTAIARAHNLCFEAGEVAVMPGGRFQVALTCPNSEWLDPRRNVFERGGHIPQALRRELERTLRGGADAWKAAPSSGDKPGLLLVTARAFSALKPGAKPARDDLEAFSITQTPSDKTARACLAGCLDLATSGEVRTPTGRKLFEALREALEGPAPDAARQLARIGEGQDEDPEDDIKECLKTGECRKLTPGEITLAMSVFGSAINYDIVRIYRRQFASNLIGRFLGLTDTLVAPNGSIYADEKGSVYAEDYSTTAFWLQVVFIHEMTHVWQHQQRIDVQTRGTIERTYVYTFTPGKRFEDYLIEQQGTIVEDYFRLLHGVKLEGKPPISVYRRLLPFVTVDEATK